MNLHADTGDVGDVSLILGLGRSSGIGSDNPLQYSCLENFMDRGAWWATVMGSQRDVTEYTLWRTVWRFLKKLKI